jgi:meso-butanediol dehydrogenase/(S,S)-butanediol dehydrogenase/diacetyl reductase
MATERPRGQVTFDNRDRIVLVTGGCRGIGLAICEQFYSSGATVVCADVNADTAGALPDGVAFRPTDVSSEASCQQVVQWVVEHFGTLDVLINNAAIQPAESYIAVDQLPTDLLRRMVDVNLLGYTFMAKYALAVMKRQQSGVVINLASGQGHRTTRGVPVYGPVKAANILQAMQWGVEYARAGIRVVSVSPGAIDTPMVRETLEAQGGAAQLANRHPIGRLGQPREVARVVLWLASDDASFVTATDLCVDGGLTAFGAFADPFTPGQSSDSP